MSMQAPDICFGGTWASELGLFVQRLPDFHRAARRVTTSAIPGSSVPVIMDEGGYDLNVTQAIINCNGQALQTVKRWLRGEGWMISSDEPDYQAYVYLYGAINDERLRADGSCYDSLTVQIQAEPYLRKVSEDAVTLSAAGSITGQGDDIALPCITIAGSGDVNLLVGGKTVLIDGLESGKPLTLDCEAGIAYITASGARTWAGQKITLVDGWPELAQSGTTAISWTGSVTSVTVQPQWRFL